MELEIGMYVRTINGKIWIIKPQQAISGHRKDIINASYDIIDLIEVGDVLIIKDFVDDACMIFTDIYLIQNEQQLLNIKSDLEKNKNKKLYSIVTSEQFSQMEYRIGE
jgi:hypothetical protein